MSERIRELARQAEAYASANEEHWHDGPDWQDMFNEKFAELIVEKCMNVTRGAITGLDAFNNIKEHFGVE